MCLVIDSDPEVIYAQEIKKFSFPIKTLKPMLKIENKGF